MAAHMTGSGDTDRKEAVDIEESPNRLERPSKVKDSVGRHKMNRRPAITTKTQGRQKTQAASNDGPYLDSQVKINRKPLAVNIEER